MYEHDIATLDRALGQFFDGERGCHIRSTLFDFGIEMRVAGKHSIDRLASIITHDLWNIAVLLARLNWTRSLAIQGTLDSGSWRTFSSLDIENLFVQVRSSMDHAAELFAFLPKGGQLPASFNKLRGSLKRYRGRMPVDAQSLIESATWFDQMRDIRNAIVHHGGMPLVFGGPEDGLLFQVYEREIQRASHPAFMYNESVVYFERYSALLIANLLVFLDDLGKLLRVINPPELALGPIESSAPGFALIREWMVETRGVLEATR